MHPLVFSGLNFRFVFGNARLFLYLGLLYLAPSQTSGALIQLVDDVFGLGEKVRCGTVSLSSMVDDDTHASFKTLKGLWNHDLVVCIPRSRSQEHDGN